MPNPKSSAFWISHGFLVLYTGTPESDHDETWGVLMVDVFFAVATTPLSFGIST